MKSFGTVHIDTVSQRLVGKQNITLNISTEQRGEKLLQVTYYKEYITTYYILHIVCKVFSIL